MAAAKLISCANASGVCEEAQNVLGHLDQHGVCSDCCAHRVSLPWLSRPRQNRTQSRAHVPRLYSIARFPSPISSSSPALLLCPSHRTFRATRKGKGDSTFCVESCSFPDSAQLFDDFPVGADRDRAAQAVVEGGCGVNLSLREHEFGFASCGALSYNSTDECR